MQTKSKTFLFIFIFIFMPAVSSCAVKSGLEPRPAPTNLRCDLLEHPESVKINNPNPRFTWAFNSSASSDKQVAYEIRVASNILEFNEPNKCLWATGKVFSNQSVGIPYAGRSLKPQQGFVWKVRTWNQAGPTEWSVPQSFQTGNFVESPDRITVTHRALVQEEIAPVRIVMKGQGHWFVDFGRAAFAGLVVNVNGVRTNSMNKPRLIVHLGEALQAENEVNRNPGGSIRYHRADLTLKPGPQTITVPMLDRDRKRMPAHIGAVMPFRYVEVENWPGRLEPNSLRQIAVFYPFDDTAATFSCSNASLNDIWELCRYSMKATSFCGLFVDGDRERLPYEADAYINQLGWYACTRDLTLPRYTHEYLITHATWPTEWPLHSVFMAWADYLYNGDTTSLIQFYEDLKAKTLIGLARKDGLISTVTPPVSRAFLKSIYSPRIQDIVDWPRGERDDYEMKAVNTVVNAFHYRALELMAKIAEALNKSDDAKIFREQAVKVFSTFNKKLFDPSTGLYVDGEDSRHSSLHANMFPLAFGLVPQERITRVVEFIKNKGMACSVYGAQYLLESLYAAGEDDAALALLTNQTDRGWWHMINRVGTTISLEAWDNKYKPNQDWNHAWGAAPANIIPRCLMGVEPLEPGWRKIRIRPQPGSLRNASLDIPTVRGDVHVDFQNESRRFVLNIKLPGNTIGRVELQHREYTKVIKLDGSTFKAPIRDNYFILEPLRSGIHRIELTGQ